MGRLSTTECTYLPTSFETFRRFAKRLTGYLKIEPSFSRIRLTHL